MYQNDPRVFWSEAFALSGSATIRVARSVLLFGLIGLAVTVIHMSPRLPNLGIEVAPYEVAGAVLSLLLVVRTNAGYERWWEARKAWGGIVNHSRNLAVAALAFGPEDSAGRHNVVRWTAAFAHVARSLLRAERSLAEVEKLLGPELTEQISAAEHRPLFVALRIAEYLHEARASHGMEGFAFLQADRERVALIDEMGACERILSAPLPKVNAIVIRQFIVLYLATLPFAMVLKVGWLTPLVTMLVAYPILSLDQMGVELQCPFSTRSLSHLPLDEISQRIEGNLLAWLAEKDKIDADEFA
ncbi:MAG TPA: bestrophin family ion channel [Isosphaeraceae bacterium]|jgi:putative membrane protein|nr:bestrophin family ion channel [Isosphaeraceae bacterium]